MPQSPGSSFNKRTSNVAARFQRAENAQLLHSAPCTDHFPRSPVHRAWNRLAPPLTAAKAEDQPQRGPFTGLLGDGLEPNRALSGLKPAPQEAPSNGAAVVTVGCSTRRQRRAYTNSSPVNRAMRNRRGRIDVPSPFSIRFAGDSGRAADGTVGQGSCPVPAANNRAHEG